MNNELGNLEAFDADGWFRTGDIGFFDEEHYLHLVDRKKELLKYRNYQISPIELELCIQKHMSSVDGVCVIGIDDDECGHLPAAVIVQKKNGAPVTKDSVIALIDGNIVRNCGSSEPFPTVFQFSQNISPIRNDCAVGFSSSTLYP